MLNFLFVFLFFHHSLHAYTDPGTGAMIWQLLMAAGFGMLFYARRIWYWVQSFWSKKEPNPDSE